MPTTFPKDAFSITIQASMSCSPVTAQNYGSEQCQCYFLAEISVTSPHKLFSFIQLNKYFLDQSIQNKFDLNLKIEALVSDSVEADM